MPNAPHNLPIDDSTIPAILALTPSRRAIGAAIADGVGIVWTDLVSLRGERTHEAVITAVRQWLGNVLDRQQPARVVIETLSSKRRTDRATMILGVIQATLGHAGYDWGYLDRKTALQHVVMKRGCRNERPTLRLAASLLTSDLPELTVHPPPKIACRGEWDRTWGQVVAAAALALCSRDLKRYD